MVTFKKKLDTGFKEVIWAWHDCTRCEIGKHVRNHVFWDTIPSNLTKVDFVFVGEGPGLQEDIEGIPFVGPAGKLLRQAIPEADPICSGCQGSGISQYPLDKIDSKCQLCNGTGVIRIALMNLVVCRPYQTKATATGNRLPTMRESMNCLPRLIDSIALFNPSVVVALGKEADSYRGTWREELTGRGIDVHFGAVKHPAFVLRQGGIKSASYKQLVNDLSELFQWYRKYGIPRVYSPELERPQDYYPESMRE